MLSEHFYRDKRLLEGQEFLQNDFPLSELLVSADVEKLAQFSIAHVLGGGTGSDFFCIEGPIQLSFAVFLCVCVHPVCVFRK